MPLDHRLLIVDCRFAYSKVPLELVYLDRTQRDYYNDGFWMLNYRVIPT